MKKMFLLLVSIMSLYACTAKSGPIDITDTVQNASVYIMVSNENPIPERGTYAWGPQYYKINKDHDVDLDVVNNRFRTNVSAEMEKKGYVPAGSSETADLIIGYAVALDASIDERDLNAAYGENFKFSFPMMPSDQTRSYHQGALIIDVLDVRAKKLLWRGALIADVDMNVSEQHKDERAAPVVRSLLDSFPKPAGS